MKAYNAKWTRTENPNVWAYDIGRRDVGTLVFDGGAQHATKIVIRTDKKTGARFNKFTGRPFNSYRDLDGDLHFWHDYYEKGTGKVYLYSAQNPGERFRSIEFNVKCHGFAVGGADGVTIDNVTVKYVGVHGIGAGTCRDLTVSNCEFGWIGGSIQAEGIFGRDYPTRLGNAVEIYGGCENYIPRLDVRTLVAVGTLLAEAEARVEHEVVLHDEVLHAAPIALLRREEVLDGVVALGGGTRGRCRSLPRARRCSR